MDERHHEEELTPPERILRLQDEWDEIANLPDPVELTAAQLEELERRLRDHRLNRRSYKTWEELRAEIEERADDRH